MLEKFVLDQINKYAEKLETKLEGDVIYYYGPTHPFLIKPFRDLIEKMALSATKKDKLCIFIKTGGGAVEPVEKMVDIIRYHYKTVWFFVPDYAMSAGTILCMSGDKIYMDYSSSLGPIDPQVEVSHNATETRLVPALGVLEQVQKLIEKSVQGTISPAEFAILQSQNLGLLSHYEHARDLSIDLAKNWLVDYKFSTWTIHRNDPNKKGQEVTREEKVDRAHQIVSELANHATWHSHGRLIGQRMLNNVLKLEIDDYSNDNELRTLIRSYNDLLTEHVEQQKFLYYMHDKRKTAEG